jgi:hypothetical protein
VKEVTSKQVRLYAERRRCVAVRCGALRSSDASSQRHVSLNLYNHFPTHYL